MTATVRLPGALRDTTGGEGRIQAHGATLAEIIADVDRQHPGFRDRVMDEAGELRAYVNVYIDEDDARLSGGPGAPVRDGATVMVIPGMAGGTV